MSAIVGSSGRRPRSAPGKPTFVKPVRIGDCPVMNAARPAVQLCWPYQSVKIAPSRATRSMLGVRYPMIPMLYALMLNQPMSSPQMIRMFGFFAWLQPFPFGFFACAPPLPFDPEPLPFARFAIEPPSIGFHVDAWRDALRPATRSTNATQDVVRLRRRPLDEGARTGGVTARGRSARRARPT